MELSILPLLFTLARPNGEPGGAAERNKKTSPQIFRDFYRPHPATTKMKLISPGLKAPSCWSVDLIWKKILQNSVLFKVPKLGDGLLMKLLQEQTCLYR